MSRAFTDNGRVALRLRPEDKARLTPASALKLLDLSDDILGAVLPKDEADIAEAARQHSPRAIPCASSRCWRTRPPLPTVSCARPRRFHAAVTATPVWNETPFAKRHDRAAFDCGDADLNHYLRKFAHQNHDRDRGGAKCFIAAPSGAPADALKRAG